MSLNVKDVTISVIVTFTFKNQAPENTLVECIRVYEAYFTYSPETNLFKIENSY